MKVYISADIEGVTGIVHLDETKENKPDYAFFQKQMTKEVLAAVEGALAAGATEILLNDAHGCGRNIELENLPQEVKIIRGWSGHPYVMLEGIDSSFNAVIYIGYHNRAGGAGNPLAHTLSGGKFLEIRINDIPATEFLINSFTASSLNIPIVFLSGDEALCLSVKKYNESIKTLATISGLGAATISLAPQLSIDKIRSGVQNALSSLTEKRVIPLAKSFAVQMEFLKHHQAYGASFYPGAKLTADRVVEFRSNDYFEVLRMLSFIMW